MDESIESTPRLFAWKRSPPDSDKQLPTRLKSSDFWMLCTRNSAMLWNPIFRTVQKPTGTTSNNSRNGKTQLYSGAGRSSRSQPSGQRNYQQTRNANSSQWRNSHPNNANAPQCRNAYSSNANAPQRRNNNGTPGRGTLGKPFKRLTDNEKAQLRKERKCFYCKKPGHIFNDCRARQRNQQDGKFVQSIHQSISSRRTYLIWLMNS
jgi:hypothetical protein